MKWLRSLIYSLKRLIHKNPRLYGPAFSVLTLNVDRIKNFTKRKLFPSSFGGMWTDRSNFIEILDQKLSSQHVIPKDAKLLQDWHEKGFVVLNGAIDTRDIDALVAEFDRLPEHLFPG